MTHDIELQLSALKPAAQGELARRILDASHCRQQRRRDCFVGLVGLLTGIAATVLVMVCLQSADNSRQTADGRQQMADSRQQTTGGRQQTAVGGRQTAAENLDPTELDLVIARYEKLLRNRPKPVNLMFNVTPAVLPSGMSLLEYRNKLLQEFGG